MKKILPLSIIVISSLLTCSCFTTQKTQHRINQPQARIMQTIQVPVISELEMVSDEKLIDSLDYYIGHILIAQTGIVPYLDTYKQYTIAELSKKYDFDILLNPLFQIHTNEEGDKLIVIVSGFPAKYKSFRNATQDDKWLFELENVSDDITSKTYIGR